jgi:hypothetical protein
MIINNINYPDFLIIGAQKCGTTWLWNMLDQHPGTDLPKVKEHHFFSKTHKYNKGFKEYSKIFQNLSANKIIGEASTSYLFDRVRKNIHMEFKNVKIDTNLPTIPELITNKMPNIKIFIVLRDPIKRAISAHYHFIKGKNYSPFTKLKKAIDKYPNRLIIEFGQFAKYIKLWQKFVPPQNIRIYILEKDIEQRPLETLQDAYEFLELNNNFIPDDYQKPAHVKMNWVSLLLNYYNFRFFFRINNLIKKYNLQKNADQIAFLTLPKIKPDEIQFLNNIYFKEKGELESILGRTLNCWDYNYTHRV